MRYGESQEDPTWDLRGMRVVGPYVRGPRGWRRLTFDEAVHVMLDREYAAIMKGVSPWLQLARLMRQEDKSGGE